jgi:putative transcriptional regulator
MKQKDVENKEKEKLQKRFGEHLVKIRKVHKITPAEMARRCFVDRSAIARLETGRTNPTLIFLKKICAALDIEMEELMKGFK